MRTVDPEKWVKKTKHLTRGRKILPLGLHQASRFEMRLRKSFADAMQEFLENCSAFGVRLIHKDILQPTRTIYWILFTFLLTCAVAVIATNFVIYNVQPPLMVNLQSQQQYNIEFPGVAICSHNVISRKALKTYAKRLGALDKNRTYSLREIESNLLAYGALVTRSAAPFKLHFIRFLANVDHETNVTNILLKLSPDCADMLQKCSWKAKPIPCHLLFAQRMTSNGFCCVMNSRYSREDSSRAPMTVSLGDYDKGVTVVVREDPDDFAYLRRPGYDTEVIIFDGSQFPIKESNGVRSYPAHRNALVLLKLDSWTQHPTYSLRYFSEDWLGCHMPQPAGGRARVETQCLLQCRRRAAFILCSCVPHALLPPVGRKVCTPEYLPCLVKHREMLSYYYPGEDAGLGLAEETSDSVDCRHCRPDCTRLVYSAAPSYAHFHSGLARKYFFNKFLTDVNLVNSTVINIYFASEYQRVYILETNLRWFETGTSLGSQWMLVCGVSFVSFWELIYFCTLRWYHHFQRRKQVKEVNQGT